MSPSQFTTSFLDVFDTERLRNRWVSYSIAIASSSAAFLLMLLLHVEVFKTPLYPFFTVAVVVSALSGGARAGLLALGCSLFYIARFIFPLRYLLATRTREAWLPLLAYIMIGLVVSWIVDALQNRQRALLESRQRLQGMFDNAGVGIVEVDASDRFVAVNSRFCEIVGYESAELIGMTAAAITVAEDRERGEKLLQQLVEGLGNRVEYEKRYVRKDGSQVSAYITVSAIRDSRGRLLRAVATVEDMTERKRAQEALIRSEKLASVGRMAAAIAHEVNNPLAGATNAVYIALSEQGLSPHGRDVLKIADQELRRAAHITAQTLAFVRDNGARTPIALPQLIDEVISVYSRKMRERGITISQRYKCGVCCEQCESCFMANAGEMRQAISSLLGNGIDALQDKGTLHVRVCRMAGLDGGPPKIRMTIADNGCGIRTENLKRIFEPFFTTKESVGTGLGLWISQQVVRKYGGAIRLKSKKDKGTVFCITFPAGQECVAAEYASRSRRESERLQEILPKQNDTGTTRKRLIS
jgi:PAS domain S-box-containing protein